MNKNIFTKLLLVVGAVALVGAGCSGLTPASETKSEKANQAMEKKANQVMMEGNPQRDSMVKDIKKDDMDVMKSMKYAYMGGLVDVTSGETVRGVTTGGNAKGSAQANFADGKYTLLATFENLPEPSGDDFYEGWVVRRQPFAFISTGKLVKEDGEYVNRYSSGQDLTAYDFYVLTIEPNDGDPTPADHIVEGAMTMSGAVMSDDKMEEKDDDMMQEDNSDDSMVKSDDNMVKDDGSVMGKSDGVMMEDKEDNAMMGVKAPVVLSLTGKNFEFSQKEIRVKEGSTVTINFTSESGFHDWAVDEFSARTKQVNTGGSTSVTFVADKKGTFEYYCSVGSHRVRGMVGNLIVE